MLEEKLYTSFSIHVTFIFEWIACNCFHLSHFIIFLVILISSMKRNKHIATKETKHMKLIHCTSTNDRYQAQTDECESNTSSAAWYVGYYFLCVNSDIFCCNNACKCMFFVVIQLLLHYKYIRLNMYISSID